MQSVLLRLLRRANRSRFQRCKAVVVPVKDLGRPAHIRGDRDLWVVHYLIEQCAEVAFHKSLLRLPGRVHRILKRPRLPAVLWVEEVSPDRPPGAVRPERPEYPEGGDSERWNDQLRGRELHDAIQVGLMAHFKWMKQGFAHWSSAGV